MSQNTTRYKLKNLTVSEFRRLRASLDNCQQIWLNRCVVPQSVGQGRQNGKDFPGFYIPHTFFTAFQLKRSLFKIPVLDGYMPFNTLKYLSVFITKSRGEYLDFIRSVSELVVGISIKLEGSSTEFTTTNNEIEIRKEIIKNNLAGLFTSRKFLGDFYIFSKVENYISPKSINYFGTTSFRFLPNSSNSISSCDIPFIPNSSSSNYYSSVRGGNWTLGDLDSDSLEFLSAQIKEEDVVRILIKLALGQSVDLTNYIKIVVSKNVLKELVNPGSSALQTQMRIRGAIVSNPALGFLGNIISYMGNIQLTLPGGMYLRDSPCVFSIANPEYGLIGFPIEAVDQKATRITLPELPQDEIYDSITLPANIPERVETVANKVLQGIEKVIRLNHPRSASTEEGMNYLKQESLKVLKSKFSFTGVVEVEEVEKVEEKQVGEFISPEELAEISAFINEGDQQEPLPDVPELDMEEDLTTEEVQAIQRQDEEMNRVESQVSPLTSEDLRQLDELAQQSNELLRHVDNITSSFRTGEEILNSQPGLHRGAIVTGTPINPFEPISIREHRADGEVTHVWVNSPNAYVAGVDPAVQQEQPVMVDTPSEAETQGETQLPI